MSSSEPDISSANAGYPSFWGAVKLFIVMMLVGIVPYGIADECLSPLGLLVAAGFLQLLACVAVLAYVQRRRPFPIRRRYPFRRLSVLQFLSIVVVGVSLCFALGPVEEALSRLVPMPRWMEELIVAAMGLDVGLSSRAGFAALLFSGALAPAIAEELFVRGLVLTSFVHRYPYRKAVILSALLFAIAHLNPWQGVSAFAGGLVMALVVLRTGSLYGAICLHFVNNALSFSILYWMVSTHPQGLAGVSGLSTPWPFYWNLLGVPVFFTSGYFFLKSTSDGREEYKRGREAFLQALEHACEVVPSGTQVAGHGPASGETSSN